MSRLEKAKRRLAEVPRDYTYSEARYLLGQLGYQESSKGRTSGSRVSFYRPDDDSIIMLHKPHPEDTMAVGAVRYLRDRLKEKGDLT